MLYVGCELTRINLSLKNISKNNEYKSQIRD
jgi:hypothetical protein